VGRRDGEYGVQDVFMQLANQCWATALARASRRDMWAVRDGVGRVNQGRDEGAEGGWEVGREGVWWREVWLYVYIITA
jgi:hypothetical protein